MTSNKAVKSDEGLYIIPESKLICVPSSAINLKFRLLVIAHCGSAGHQGIVSSFNALKVRFYWQKLFEDVTTFCKNCLHCTTNRGGNVIPRSFGRAIHASQQSNSF
uniref:Integrase zinc-binding domain-containing protein n=1 Tax=Spongospora subterranea TaxID=70186 RepID=A0A0H5R8C4_9EUKA|eukprot:CRZ04579.1 hypothetical protein [Spongospora subterranea]